MKPAHKAFQSAAAFLPLLLLLLACGNKKSPSQENTPAYINQQWAADALWDDGLAEVARYQAERVVYGKPRQFEYVHILVKEDFNKKYNVKTEDYSREDLFPVMKVNKFARIPTQKYPYHYLTSLFFKREEPSHLHKMTSSSQEWCGNTFKLFEDTGNKYRYLYSSYWDGQGNDYMKLDGNLWFEDALSYSLRALNFAVGLQFEEPVVESQISNKASKPQVYQAHFLISQGQLQLQEGIQTAWQVRVQLDEDKINTYWFAQEYPNILLRQQSWDGRNLSLQAATREAYWAAE